MKNSITPPTPKPKLLVLSAADENGINRIGQVYSRHFSTSQPTFSSDETVMHDLAYTLDSRRTSLPWKSFATIDSPDQLPGLENILSKPVKADKIPSLGFIFTGQGAQWAQMGVELRRYPLFRQSLDKCEAVLYNAGCDWSLHDELDKDKSLSKINRPDYSQPLCTAVQVAIVDLLRSFGAHTSGVIGHSSGEIAAAYAIGALSFESAMRISFFRGLVAKKVAEIGKGRGAMMSVGLPANEAQAYVDELSMQFGRHGIVVACINSPKNVTISGDRDQIDALHAMLTEKEIFARKLKVDVAYHSPHMKAVADEYLALMGTLSEGNIYSKATMISSVTGQRINSEDLRRPEYWVKNLTSPVRFSEALGKLSSTSNKKIWPKIDGSHRRVVKIDTFMEIGPHAALQGPSRDIFKSVGSKAGYLSALIRNISGLQSLLDALGTLFCQGCPIHLSLINRPAKTSKAPKVMASLPEYPFNHSQSYWFENRISKEMRFGGQKRLDLLGKPVADWNPLEPRWRNIIKESEMPWVRDHQINGVTLYPAAGMLVMAIEAANQLADSKRSIRGFRVKEAAFHTALVLSSTSQGTETQLHLLPTSNGQDKDASKFQFRLYAHLNEQFTKICDGIIIVEYETSSGDLEDHHPDDVEPSDFRHVQDVAEQRCIHPIKAEEFYKCLDDSGFNFGTTFQSLEGIFSDGQNCARADIKLHQWLDEQFPQDHIVHPTTLDGMMHISLAAITKGTLQSTPTMVPTSVADLWVSKKGLNYPEATSVRASVSFEDKNMRGVEASVSVTDTHKEQPLALLKGLTMTAVTSSDANEELNTAENHLCYKLERKPDIDLLSKIEIMELCHAAKTENPEPVDFYQDLAFLQFKYISDALKVLRTQPQTNITGHYQKYVEWMEYQTTLYRTGNLPQMRGYWEYLLQDTRYCEQLTKTIEQTNNQGRLNVLVAQNLVEILLGNVDPLELFFKTDLMQDFYLEVNQIGHCHPQFCRLLDLIAHKTPQMKILEIGAGTGGMTTPIMEVIGSASGNRRYGQYDFTDLSTYFFEKAQNRFSGEDAMIFSKLNIEEDPTDQGFEAGSYDVIVAGNALHATKDMAKTLRNVRKLLKPDGRLVLWEIARPELTREAFHVGLLEGWWSSTDSHRAWGPCMNEETWHGVLGESGFSGVDFTFQDYEDEACHEMDIMVSTAKDADLPPQESQTETSVSMIIDRNSTSQAEMAAGLGQLLRESGALRPIIQSVEDTVQDESDVDQIKILLLELDQPYLSQIDGIQLQQLQAIFASSSKIIWITREGTNSQPAYAMINGLSRVYRAENPTKAFVTVALGTEHGSKVEHLHTIIRNTIASQGQYEPEYVEHNGKLEIARMLESREVTQSVVSSVLPYESKALPLGQCLPLQLTMKAPGLLDTLRFTEDAEYYQPLASDDVEIRVQAVGLNFRDLLIALGKLSETSLGQECAGTVSRCGPDSGFTPGDRVTFVRPGTCRTFARVSAVSVARVPKNVSLQEAATVAVPFVTSYQVIHKIAHMEEGESILIHSAAGSTGQAAIQMCQALGVEVFATVGSKEKKQFLMDQYSIPSDHIFNSRNTEFVKGIKRRTNNRGVDAVLNSLAGESLAASWECIAPYGRFIEIGKADILSNTKLSMAKFEKNVSFTAFDGMLLARDRPAVVTKATEHVLKLISKRKLHTARPLLVHPISQVTEAFRAMQDGKIIGRTVLSLSDDDVVPTYLKTNPRSHFRDDKTYVIAGGLGGLGRVIARWMVERGARYLMLLSRSGPRDDAQRTFLSELRGKGAIIETPACDITDRAKFATVLKNCSKTMPEVNGLIQASMVLRDAIFDNMTFDDWKTSVSPKVQGSWNLHTLLPGDLDFCIYLSSVSGLIGTRGQANYAAANTYMDALAAHRQANGLSAVSIDLGAMLSEGYLAENDTIRDRLLSNKHFAPISLNELFALLDHYCHLGPDNVDPQAIIGIEVPANIRAQGIDIEPWLEQSLFSHLHNIRGTAALNATNDSSAGGEQATDFRKLFLEAASRAEAGAVVTEAVVKRLGRTLTSLQEEGGVDTRKPMHTYGVDSLLAVELRTWFVKEFAADVAVFEILGGASFVAVGMTVAEKTKLKGVAWS